MKNLILIFLIVLSFLLVISGCQDVAEIKEKTTTEQSNDGTSKVVKQSIPGVTKFEAPKDIDLGVPENKNLIFVLGNDGTASSTVFKVEVFEESETNKVDVQLPGGEFYTIQRGDEKRIGIGIRTEKGTEKGSNVKFAIKVTNNGEDYVSGNFIVSV